jgi:glycosyltransferase involved in cell wall biosynthesis
MSSSKRIRIGFVAPELSSRNGWARYSRSLVEAVSHHAEVRVLTERNAQNDTILSDVHKVLPVAGFGLKAQIGVFLHAYRLLGECDVVHCLVEPYAPAAAFAAHMRGVPITMTLHGTYAVPPKSPGLKRFAMRYMYSRMPVVTSGSPYTEQKAREAASLGECRIIPNGVNLEKFQVLPSVQKEDLILTVGMLKPRKGVDTVLEAFAKIKDVYPALRYSVVADDSGDAFSKKVHAMVGDLGLTDRVTFHQHISDEELVALYNRAKAFVLAARTTDDGMFEGFPMVFYEANACGTPVITSRGFGSEYAIHDGENGFLVNQDNPEQVAEALSKLLDDDARYLAMRSRAIEEAKKHTWDKIAQILIGFYDDVIRARHGNRQ